MDQHELARILKNFHAYGKKRGDATLMVHLFSIRYAQELHKWSVEEIRKLADIPNLDATITDGRKLAPYVSITGYGEKLLDRLSRTE